MDTKLQSIFSLPFFNGNISFLEDVSIKSSGARVWSSAIVLAKYLERNRRKILPQKISRNFHCLELGAGTGVNSIMLAKIFESEPELYSNFSVTMTDIPLMLPLLQQNVTRNVQHNSVKQNQVFVKELSWTSDTNQLSLQTSQLISEKFDLIFGSDVVYMENDIQPLLDTIKFLCKSSSTQIYICYEIRNEVAHELFLEKAQTDFEIKSISSKKQDSEFRNDKVLLYQLHRKEHA